MNTHLLFANIPRTTSSQELVAFCSFDDIVPVSAVVRVDPVTDRSLGVGFVTFASVDDAARAAEALAGKVLGGSVPRVSIPSAAEIASFAV